MTDQKVSGRNLFLHINVSVDGYICDPRGEIDWRFSDGEFQKYLDEMLEAIGGMVLGRVAFEQLASYWPTADSAASPVQRRRMHELPKFVLSRSVRSPSWHNSHVLEGDPANAIAQLKQQAGPPLALFAGASAAQTVLRLRLLDELRLVVNPVLVGGGRRLFDGEYPPSDLRLRELRRFASGAVLIVYGVGAR